MDSQDSQPLWIVGAPRSGTTFIAAMFNSHPQVTLTNESRLFVLLKQLIEVDCTRPEMLDAAHRDRFVSFLKRNAGSLIERFYREELAVDTPIWGDKHPPYADPALLSRRPGGAAPLPRSGSALRLINEALPASKFIHIHRAPDQVAHSLVSRGWVTSHAEGVAVRNQYVDEIEGFFAEIAVNRRLSVGYSDMLRRPAQVAGQIARFLGIDAVPMLDFLNAQRQAPTPMSNPVRDLNEVYRAI